MASKLDMPKKAFRRVLTGADPLLVDDLLRITQILDLDPEQMGVPEGIDDENMLGDEALGSDSDHWGNQPRILVETGFRVGIDFILVVDVAALGVEWGGPEPVRQRYLQAGQQLTLKLDALYHEHMKAEYEEDLLHITLSFDTLYRCKLPWGAIQRVVFDPLAPEPPEEEEEQAPPESDKPAAPFLRLVT